MKQQRYGGVWSAAPTPFTREFQVDCAAVRRMVEHHVRLGVRGLFLAGTNGEGPWMTRAQRVRLVREVVRCNRGRMTIAVQVTENSASQMLENIELAKMAGADIAVIAPPFFLLNATPVSLLRLYRTVIRNSPLPMGVYDRGAFGAVAVPDAIMARVYDEPRVVIVKDSSMNPARREIALAARRRRPRLCLMNGYEWDCVTYLEAGYDGLLLGGGAFNGHIAALIVAAVRDGDHARAANLQKRMNRMMWAAYGGKAIKCWLAGEKYLLKRLGIFGTWRNLLQYPLTPSCRAAIERTLVRDRDLLLP